MSKMFQCLSVMAAIAIGFSQTAEAGNLAARGGKSDFPVSEPACWGVNGATIWNKCSEGKYWYIALPNLWGSFWIAVTAQAANNSSNVQCISTGSARDGTFHLQSGWFPLPQFGVSADINLLTTIPSGGTGMVDCYALQGGKVHTVSW